MARPKPQCTVEKGVKRCQLCIHPNHEVCWFHLNNPRIKFPRELDPVQGTGGVDAFREKLLEAQSNVCAICGIRFKKSRVSVDHMHPRILGGKHVLKNLGAVHVECNSLKSGFALYDPILEMNLFGVSWRSHPFTAVYGKTRKVRYEAVCFDGRIARITTEENQWN